MNEKSKFVRFLLDVEVEVVDPVSVTTAVSGIAESENGPRLVTGLPGEGWNEGTIAMRVLLEGLHSRSKELGLKPGTLSAQPRPVHEDGYYSDVTISASPRRQADGSFIDPPGFPPMTEES